MKCASEIVGIRAYSTLQYLDGIITKKMTENPNAIKLRAITLDAEQSPLLGEHALEWEITADLVSTGSNHNPAGIRTVPVIRESY
ncbi:MAG: hypothetical protein M3247_08560 [Thermoproteota archaeon]|nr:hypothetical protein [Thermoproteota archaeon]